MCCAAQVERVRESLCRREYGNRRLLGASSADSVQTLNQLIYIIDDRELYAAIVELLKAEGRAPNLVPY
jgi:hypothetical protein